MPETPRARIASMESWEEYGNDCARWQLDTEVYDLIRRDNRWYVVNDYTDRRIEKAPYFSPDGQYVYFAECR